MKGNLLIFLLFVTICSKAQDVISQIKNDVTREEIETHIRFLASDALMGREAGTPEIDIAAAYIEAYFQSVGVKKLPEMDSYFQAVPLYVTSVAKGGDIELGGTTFNLNDDFITDFAEPVNLSAPVVFINYGSEADITKNRVDGKIAILLAGDKDANYQEALSHNMVNRKIDALKNAGAKGAIVLWHYKTLPWSRFQAWVQRETLTTTKPEVKGFPYFYINAMNDRQLKNLKSMSGESATVNYEGREIKEMTSYNVIGYVEGTDANAKDEYLLLGAHYDHVGGEITNTGEDRIYNGARDNAVGTAAVMLAGDYFADHKPKHSVILAAWTAEEKGLIGSSFFAENPPVDLDKIIYNLNIDNAGYNDTTIVTVIGLDRTKAKDAIVEASAEFDLKAVSDPAPEQNLFDRSDNVNFAKRGIPSPTFSLGFTAFDEQVLKYYHQVEDEPETINYSYITRYTRAFVLAAQKIADQETDTFWVSGDKYEDEGKALYNK